MRLRGIWLSVKKLKLQTKNVTLLEAQISIQAGEGHVCYKREQRRDGQSSIHAGEGHVCYKREERRDGQNADQAEVRQALHHTHHNQVPRAPPQFARQDHAEV